MPEIDRDPRYVPYTTFIVRGGCCHSNLLIQQVNIHSPNQHPENCPLRKDCVAVELLTDKGSRWWGFEDAYINSELRAVVMGFSSRDEIRSKWEKVPADNLDRGLK